MFIFSENMLFNVFIPSEMEELIHTEARFLSQGKIIEFNN